MLLRRDSIYTLMLSVIILSVVLVREIMLIVVMLNAGVLTVVAPQMFCRNKLECFCDIWGADYFMVQQGRHCEPIHCTW
jgi:hypothetical protein